MPAATAQEVGARFESMQREIDALRTQTVQQAERIDALQRANGEAWLTDQRAQQIRGIVADVLSDSATRASLQGDGATAGYEKNFFIASADGNFRLNLEGELQVRAAYNHIPNASLTGASANRSQVQNEYGWEIRRMKLNIFGHVIDPSWTYRIQIAALRNGSINNSTFRLEDIFIQKALIDGLYARVGQWKNVFNFEEYTSSRTQQMVERSLVNQYYSTKFVQGALLGWQDDSTQLFASYNDGGGNRDIQVIQSSTGNLTEYALTLRAQRKFGGSWGQFTDMQGWRGSDFALLVGAGLNWQRAGGVPPSTRAYAGNGALPALVGSATVNDQVSLLTYTADLSVRADGWSVFAAFLGNYLYGGGAVANSVGVNESISYGVVAQGGYFLTNELEAVARYEGLWVQSDNHNISSGNALVAQSLNIVTAGFNYYFAKNDVKFTFDAGYSFEPLLFSNGLFGESVSGADWRPSQTGLGGGELVIRGQMQLLF